MRWLAALTVFLTAFLAIDPAMASSEPWQLGLQDAGSPIMERISSFHTLLLWIITLITLFTGVYTVFGGLRAVLYTDMLQMFVLIGGEALVEHLHRDPAAELGIGGEEDLAHAAGAEAPLDLVARDRLRRLVADAEDLVEGRLEGELAT